MATLTIRVSEWQLQELRTTAERRGVSVSSLVRDVLFGAQVSFSEPVDYGEEIERLDRRLSRLEELAGL